MMPGVALTTAVTWTPQKGLSITGALLAVDDNAAQRVLVGKPTHGVETRAQLAMRLAF